MLRSHWALAAFAAFGLTAMSAAAQERIERKVDAPMRSFEFGVGLGYTQGAGNIRQGERVSSLAGVGGESQVDLGFRIDPRWMVGGYGSFGYYNTPNNAGPEVTVRGVTTGVQGQYHFLPYNTVDPWVSLGAGYRGLFSSGQDGPVTARHGIQLARVRAGLDYRLNPAVALGPVVGVDANYFTGQRAPGQDTTMRIEPDVRTVTPFFFAGLAGRFDVVNERMREGERRVAMAF